MQHPRRAALPVLLAIAVGIPAMAYGAGLAGGLEPSSGAGRNEALGHDADPAAIAIARAGSPGRAPAADGSPGGESPGGAVEAAQETTDPTPAAGAAVPRTPEAESAATNALLPGSVNRTSLSLQATYDVAVTLRYGTRLLAVDTLMTITNTSGGPIDRLELNTIAARLGRFHLKAASVAGQAVAVRVDDQTLIVPLGGVLPAGQTVKARLIFSSTLRSDLAGSNWMFTRVNGIVDAYRWLPWISLRRPFDRPNHGDPFVTPVSPSVRVRITTDRPLVIATSGDRVAVAGLSQTFVAQNVRDFTITAAPDYRTGSKVVGDTTVRVWYRAGAPATAMLAAAVRALGKMESLVGPYPYRFFKVVQSAGGYGMESPGLIWIPTGVGSTNLSYLVHHETAHQWFYGIVGDDQAYEPFTDEAPADFLARYALGLRRSSRCSTARLDRSIYVYSSTCYYEVIYIQGGNFLDDIRRSMGSTAFWKAVRGWIAANRFKIASTKSLLDALDAATPLNLVPRYEPRFPRLY